MSKKQDLFTTGMAYTIDMIAKKLSRSSNYVDGRLTKVEPCAEIATEAGPYARGWSGYVLNKLVDDGVLSKTLEPGTIIWKKPPRFTNVVLFGNVNGEVKSPSSIR
tara:strand:+ start:586 stop:903 length:318 start_codon:yes stop_codon:yes gene_type:complete